MQVEEYFGPKAGAAWKALRKEGPLTIAVLRRRTGLSANEAYAALGWLAREGKIQIIGESPLGFKYALKE
jgi:hypothetical protein